MLLLSKRIFLILCLVLNLAVSSIIAQNTTCQNAAPFCTGTNYNFPASTNAGSAQSGPNYGCLGSQPNPAWYFMQIGTSGSIQISMAGVVPPANTSGYDVDFICW